MGKYEEVHGNLITMALEKKFDVISHGCNCFCKQKSGIAKDMVSTFQTDRFPKEDERFLGIKSKLGTIDSILFNIDGDVPVGNFENEPDFIGSLYVVNSYTQYNYGKNHKDGEKKPIVYEAVRQCMKEINQKFKGEHVGLPLIGSGLAGGDWSLISKIIKEELIDCDVTIVRLEK